MKKIITGQLMMWSNLLGVVIGYVLFEQTGIKSEFLTGLLGLLGVCGSIFNLFIACALQVKWYNDSKILDLK